MLRQLQEVSWNFDGARSRSAFSWMHFHPGRFISQLPSILISLMTEPGQVVLDPYCGSGTTLVEAQRLNRQSIGFDVNPVSALISRAKTLQLSEAEVFSVLTDQFESLVKRRLEPTNVGVPAGVQLKKWYSDNVSAALKRLYYDIATTENPNAKTLKMFCFSSILMKISRESRHWGYVCDNTAPKGNPHRDVQRALQDSIEGIRLAFRERASFLEGQEVPVAEVYEDQAHAIVNKIPFSSVDLIVTSPPYFGVVDYVKSQRLSMEWFDFDIEFYRKRETGARSKRHRKNAINEFETEIERSFAAMRAVLKPGRLCAVLFGASNTRSFQSEQLLNISESAGLVTLCDFQREISVQRRQKPSVLLERLFVFQKPLSN